MFEKLGLISVVAFFWLKAPEKKSAALKVFVSATSFELIWFLNSNPVAITVIWISPWILSSTTAKTQRKASTN